MKKGIVSLLFMSVVLLTTSAVKSAGITADFLIDPVVILGDTLDVIDWKVGDYANYDMELGFFGKGTVKKSVTKDDGKALWLDASTKTSMGDQLVQTLIRKADGKVLKLIVNGEEQEYQEPKMEIIEQRTEEVTVPAGTFKAIYVKAKEKSQEADIEVWINPIKIPVGGMAKSVIQKSFLKITMVLTNFGNENESDLRND